LKDYVLGDPLKPSTSLGPVVSKAAVATINRHVTDAVEKGAELVTLQNESFKNPPPTGNYVAPSVLTNVDHSMLIMNEETFGPVIPIMKVTGDEEAISLMNDSEYGLSASIWTKDVDLGHQLAEEVEAGTVFVNRCDYPSPVICHAPTITHLLTCSRIWPGQVGRTLEKVKL
jgi:acyl-CoA reductase-like NAD-dependent aldehyde dehydrogenase